MRKRRFHVLLLITLLLGACTQDPNVKKQQYLERGLAYHKEGKYNEAILQLKNALQIDPKFVPALHAIGRAYRAKSWTVDAMRELQRAVEAEPDNLEARADLAQAYLDLDGWNAALEQADAIKARAPESAAELYVRGAALNGKGDAQQAVALLSKALTLGTATPEEFAHVRKRVANPDCPRTSTGREQFESPHRLVHMVVGKFPRSRSNHSKL